MGRKGVGVVDKQEVNTTSGCCLMHMATKQLSTEGQEEKDIRISSSYEGNTQNKRC